MEKGRYGEGGGRVGPKLKLAPQNYFSGAGGDRTFVSLCVYSVGCAYKVLFALNVFTSALPNYEDTGMCITDSPYEVQNLDEHQCASQCLQMETCDDFNHKNDVNECALFIHKPLFYDSIPGCTGYKVSYNNFYICN